VWKRQGAKRMKKEESSRKDDYEHKKGFGDTKKRESDKKENIMVGRIKYGKGSLRIWDICIRDWGYREKIRRVKKRRGRGE